MARHTVQYVRINPRLGIRYSELRFSFSRSAGPGGQNVNKVNTRVTLRFDLGATRSLTPAQQARVRSKLYTRIDSAGVLRVVSARHRTQAANRRAAVTRFAELLADALTRPKHRIRTAVPRSAREQRLREKARQSGTKRLRSRRPSPDD